MIRNNNHAVESKGKRQSSASQSLSSTHIDSQVDYSHVAPPSSSSLLPKDDKWYIAQIQSDSTLAEASKRQYINKLTKLSSLSGKNMEWVLLHAEESLKLLKEYLGDAPMAQTVHAFCASVAALYKRLPREYREKFPNEYGAWVRCNEDSSKDVRFKYENWIASDRQRDNFVPWEELIRKRDELGKNPATRGSNAHLLLSMLTYLPPMRTSDLGSMRLFTKKPKTVVSSNDDKSKTKTQYTTAEQSVKHDTKQNTNNQNTKQSDRQDTKQNTDQNTKNQNSNNHQNTKQNTSRTANQNIDTQILNSVNYIILFKNYGTITINEYKTAKYYKSKAERATTTPQTLESKQADRRRKANASYSEENPARRHGILPRELFLIIKESYESCPRNYLFVDAHGNPFLIENSFTKMAHRALASAFGGKALNVNLIRHAAAIWIDEHHRHNAPLRKYFEYWMMHSRNMQNEYVLANNMRSLSSLSSLSSQNSASMSYDEDKQQRTPKNT